MEIISAWFVSKRVFAIEICNFYSECLTEAEWRTCPCAAGIFPLCFAWQLIVASSDFREILAELLRILPGNAFHGQVVAFESAWRQFPHDRFPLSLCDEEFSHHERFDRDKMLRLFVRVSHVTRGSHLEDARRDNDQLKVDTIANVFCELLGSVMSPRDDLALFVQGGCFEFDGLHG